MVICLRKIVYLFFILFSFSILSQEKKIDSLLQRIELSTNKRDKIKTYMTLIEMNDFKHDSISIKQNIEYSERASKLALEIKDSAIFFEIKLLLSRYFVFNNLADYGKKYLDEAYAIAKQINNDSIYAKINLGLAIYYSIYEEYKNIEPHIYKSLEYAKTYKTKKINSTTYNLIGNKYLYFEDTKLAYQNYKTALQFALDDKDDRMINVVYSNIGIVLEEEGNFEKAKDIYLKYFNYLKKQGPVVRSSIYYDLGMVYSKLKDFDKSLEYFIKALEFSESDINISQHIVYLEIGNCYKGKKDYLNAKINFKKALDENDSVWGNLTATLAIASCDYFISNKILTDQQVKALVNKLENQRDLVSFFNALGFYYEQVGHIKKSIKYYTLSLDKTPKNMTVNRLSILNALHSNYSKIGNYKKTYTISLEIIKIKDSLDTASDLRYIASRNLVKNYEEEILSQSKEILSQQLLISNQEKEILKKKTQTSYVTGFLVAILLLSLVFWMRFQHLKNIKIEKTKAQLKLNEAYKIIESDEMEKKVLADFIHENISQDLISISYSLELLKNEEKVNSIFKQLSTPISKLREISYNLSPPALNFIDIEDVIKDYVNEMAKKYNKDLFVEFDGGKIELNSDQKIALYRIVQELVKNTLEHSKSTEGYMKFTKSKNHIHLLFKDNGKGFQPNWQEGLGWKKIKYRMIILNATHKIESSEKGSSISINLELAS